MDRNPVLIAYPGYANNINMVVTGHLLKKAPKHWFLESGRVWKNIKTMILLFRVKSVPGEKITLSFYGNNFDTYTDANGFFRFEVNHLQKNLPVGYHHFEVSWLPKGKNRKGKNKIGATGSLIRPSLANNSIITDVDDTLMISHSQSPVRKLFTLLTKTPKQRKVFKDVADHYALLTQRLKNRSEGVSFMAYISSSEWNLYPFIREFCRLNGLPQGVYLLRKIKNGWLDLLRSGKGNHMHKLKKITDVFNFYPESSFILLGDDRQKDPEIYSKIAHLFPQQIACIYIRNSGYKKRDRVNKLLEKINRSGIPVLYYRNSKTAIAHSVKIGLIDKVEDSCR